MLIAGCALALAGCMRDGDGNLAAAQPRGATVAFDQIDGPPPEQFKTLVRELNDEAQARRLAVISREDASAYRVRGTLAAEISGGKTTISWVWDVFDRDEQRALRIEGKEQAKDKVKDPKDAWAVADAAMMRRIAQTSMEQLAAFLTSPEAMPTAATPAQTAFALPDASSPEAAGIFRIFHARADPLPASDAEPADSDLATTAARIPLPPRRPRASGALAVSAL